MSGNVNDSYANGGLGEGWGMGAQAQNPAFVVGKAKLVLEPGMVVRLKSGSPALTVTSVNAMRQASVQWWNGEKMDTAHFHFDCLNLDDKPT